MTESTGRRANCCESEHRSDAAIGMFTTLQVEGVHQLRYVTRARARHDIVIWIEGFYVLELLHSSIGNARRCLQNPARLLRSLTMHHDATRRSRPPRSGLLTCVT
jgi:hypothetical protein